jgi:sulfotransferase famil protein
MIISHRYRYVFVELPRTGSSAVRRELRELYDGAPILHKHSTYDEFRRQASEKERAYFVFSAIRNPLDDAVSRYFKLKTDHHQRFSDTSRHKRQQPLPTLLDSRMFRFLQAHDPDFSTFFLHFYRLPYDTWASLDHRRMDFVMRFERLSDDFDAALRRIGIEPDRRLPSRNETGSRDRDFASYYTPAARRRALRVFGPYMRRWGYHFPEDWDLPAPSAFDELSYRAYSGVARAYWTYIRPRTWTGLRPRT